MIQTRRIDPNLVVADSFEDKGDFLRGRGYLSEEERDDGAAIKKAIEGVISDMAFELRA
jgi:hypothetical protein